jgi:signal peptidase I
MGADQGLAGDADRSGGPAGASRAPRLRFGFAVVRGRSMLPTLADSDRLLVRYLQPRARPYQPGRLVVCHPPERPVAVKRLGRRVDDAHWWVQSDNAVEGTDSRVFGALPDRSLVAVVVCRVWPRPSRLRRSARRAAVE